VAVEFEGGQAVAELPDDGSRRVVHEHVLRPRLRTEIVHERDAAVEVMALKGANRAAHLGGRDRVPFQARDEGTRERGELLQHAGEGAGRRILHCEDLHVAAVDIQVVAVAIDR
jgi:hypothetical protein